MTRSQLVVPAVAVLAVCVMMTAHLPAQSSSGGLRTRSGLHHERRGAIPICRGSGQPRRLMGVPLQRDPALGTRAYLTDEEFAQRQKQASRQAAADGEEFAAPAGGWRGRHWPPEPLARTRDAAASGIAHRRSAERTDAGDDTGRRAPCGGSRTQEQHGRRTVQRSRGSRLLRSLRLTWRRSARSRQWSTTTAPRSCRARATWPSASR